jgi:four helix bundle protein
MRKYDYTELVAWQRAMDLAVSVYRVSRSLPQDERFGLTTQVRRAAVSVPGNIAEGQCRRTSGEFLNCLSHACGSIGELETHMLLSGRLQFIDAESVAGILDQSAEVGRLVNGLMRSLKDPSVSIRQSRRSSPTTDN